MVKEKKVVIGPAIIIKGTVERRRVIQKVVNTFIKTESRIDFKEKVVYYPVENTANKPVIYLVRPGYKKNFDFYVNYEGKKWGLTKKKEVETHIQIGEFLKGLSDNKPRVFAKVWKAIKQVYLGEEYDVERLIKINDTAVVNIIKLLKWMFIMEDILYWGYAGRAFLYNALNYYVNTTDRGEFKKYYDPGKLKRDLAKLGIEWVEP